MSMPSSSEDVATTAGSRPALSSSSTSCALLARHRAVMGPGDDDLAGGTPGAGLGHDLRRRFGSAGFGRDALPLGLASSFSRALSRSASRRELANTIVERWASIRSSTRSSTCGQIDVRRSAPAAAAGQVAGRLAQRGHVLDRHDDLQLERLRRRRLRRPSTGRPPARNVATSSTGRTVAESPIALRRRVEQRVEALERQRPGGRRAWWRTPRAPRRRSRCRRRAATRGPPDVSSRNSDSGVVIRMSGGRRANSRRSSAGVSPVRIADGDVGLGQAEPGRGLPDAGQRGAQVALDVDGQRLERADVEHPAAALRVVGHGSARPAGRATDRNAASVLPEPVGATTRVCSPRAMASQAPACAGVAPRTHRRTTPAWLARRAAPIQCARRV